MNEVFSERLKASRKKYGLKAKELAEICGISASYLSELESGKRFNPANLLVEKFATECGTTVDWLLGRTDTPPPSAPLPMEKETSGACRYPEGCDLENRLLAVENTLQYMSTQLETVVALLGAALREGLDHADKQHRKTG